ncbi:L,D-transpeptidase family protein [bacterium]|nr:L,D-transpeptidase family protein [bacterium]RQV94400.1 MAG: hypothetical protein EH221_08095 [bacterium]
MKFKKTVIKKNKIFGNSSQLIIACLKDRNSYTGFISCGEINNDKFNIIFKDIPAVFGKNGLGKSKEGDNKTPEGIFKITGAFGSTKPSFKLNIPFHITSQYDYWIDDPNSKDYNTLVYFQGDPDSKWNSYERLNNPLYKYAIIYDYNKECISGLGSALFIHIWKNPEVPTSGCTAVSEKDLMKIIKWLDINKNPILIQGCMNEKIFIQDNMNEIKEFLWH